MNWAQNIKHHALKIWLDEVVNLVTPDDVIICNGSDDEINSLYDLMVTRGMAIRLNPEKRPNSYLFRSSPDDVARVEKKTFICTASEKEAGPTNNWKDPRAMMEEMTTLFRGCMKGRTMYVVPFCMGPLNSPFSMIGIEITDSPYVVCSMKIMARMGQEVLEALGDNGNFVKCWHSVGVPLENGKQDTTTWPCNPKEIRIAHFPEEESIMSFGSGYGGNALLGKKCLALRIASYVAKQQGWLAEHMLVIGITNPKGIKRYIAASFPSACGKTNLAMLMPKIPGWKVDCLGDDIAWIRPGEDGRLYAVNPEFGFFGVAPGTSEKTNPNALASCASNSMFTNVAMTADNDVWWEGLTEEAPQNLTDWKGNPWVPGKEKAAHPNSRFTAPLMQCPNLDSAWNDPKGVPLSAIIFGGRREDTVPLVYESLNWNHGVTVGASMSSAVTAASVDVQKPLRHDPFAMLPFCGYNMGEYFQHWISLGKKNLKLPKIFNVNWFRKDDKGQFIWPGFSENLRVLEWILRRLDGEDAIANSTPIGFIPKKEFLNLEGLDISDQSMDKILQFNAQDWEKEIVNIREYLELFKESCPKEILLELDKIEKEIKK